MTGETQNHVWMPLHHSAFRPCIGQHQGRPFMDKPEDYSLWKDVSSCQNAAAPALLSSTPEDLCLWCAQIQNSGKGVKGNRNLSLTFRTHLGPCHRQKVEKCTDREALRCYSISNKCCINCENQMIKTKRDSYWICANVSSTQYCETLRHR